MATLDLPLLRGPNPLAIRDYLTSLLTTTTPSQITPPLLAAVAAGSIPATPTVSIYLSIADSADAIHGCLRFPDSTTVRKLAVKNLKKWFRSDDTFLLLWEVMGGVQGFMGLLFEASVEHVKNLCCAIGRSAFAGECPRRSAEMTKLFVALEGLDYGDMDRPVNPDKRNIGIYQAIAPACSSDFAVWYWRHYEDSIDENMASKLFCAHPRAFQRHCLAEVFPPSGTGKLLAPYRPLLRDDVEFAQECITRLSLRDEILFFNENDFIPEVALPLIRQLQRRGAPFHQINAAWSAVLACVRKLHERRPGSVPVPTLTRRALRFWRRFDGKEGGAQAEAFVGQILSWTRYTDFSSLEDSLRVVDVSRRVAVLKMVTEHVKPEGFSLNDVQAANMKIKEIAKPWPLAAFLMLPNADAIALLERLISILPEDGTVSFSSTIANDQIFNYAGPGSNTIDPKVLLAHLKSRSPEPAQRLEAEKIGAELFETWKAKAMRESRSEDRPTRVCTAMACAVASGSFKVYKGALRWARRYNKDNFTVRALYFGGLLATEASVALLSGIPPPQILRETSPTQLLADIKAGVKEGNEILVFNSETAAMGIQEPSFQRHIWNDFLQLFGRVGTLRLNQCHELLEKHGLSDEQVWDAVLQPTLDMLIDREVFAMAKENDPLEWCRPRGFLYWYERQKGARPARVVERFFNELAERRDKLWAGYRARSEAGVTTLEWPWPRGLPFQVLTSVKPVSGLDVPYLSKLAERVVFMDEETAGAPLSTDEETRKAIGRYVHRYTACLQYYVKTAPDSKTANDRRAKAWAHALAHITEDRMNPLLSKMYWETIFHSSEADIGVSAISTAKRPVRQTPTLPEADAAPVEWHPVPNPPVMPKRHSDTLNPTVGDAIVHAINRDDMMREGNFHVPHVSPPHPPSLPSFYDLKQYPLSWTAQVRDPLIAAAILSLNTRYGADQSLLMTPFPSGHDSRFPAMYLDQAFLEGEDPNTRSQVYWHEQLRLLQACRFTVPTSLLAQLAHSLLLQTQKQPDDPSPHRLMQKLVRLLCKSDNPSSAARIILHVITERPEDSSWHRFLLGKGFLRSLPFSSAKSLFEDIASGLMGKWEAQITRPPPATEDEAYSRTPLVKISTIKMVAQLLGDNADFLDARSVSEILTRLLKECGQYDVFNAVLEGLRQSFCNAYDAEDRFDEGIMGLLDNVIVPRASSVNERWPPADWAWDEDEVPPVVHLLDSYERSSGYPALQATLLSWADDLRRTDTRHNRAGHPSSGGDIFLSRIVFPMIRASVEQNTRWTNRFLQYYGFAAYLPENTLPPIPVHQGILREMFNQFHERTEAFPSGLYAMLHTYCMTLLNPPPGLVEVNARIKDDPMIRGTEQARHWNSLWGFSARQAVGLGLRQAAMLLASGIWEGEKKPRELTYEQVRENTLSAFEALMEVGEVEGCYKLLDAMRPRESPGSSEYKNTRAAWEKYAAPVLERAIALVEKRRSPAWNADPQRTPRRLPDPLRIRVRNFLAGRDPDYDYDYDSDSNSDSEMFGPVSTSTAYEDEARLLATDIAGVVDMIIDSGRPYHGYIYNPLPGESGRDILTPEAALKTIVKGNELMLCTVFAGDIGQSKPVGLKRYVRLELVCRCVLKNLQPHKMDREKARALRRLLKGWFECADSVVREMVEGAAPMVGPFKKWMEEDEEMTG